ncbi:H/ACA ribonucleoprotein complex non-core subunit NAF1 [Quillaja saponaria]|uniref:H/ACA ribonucleoprotein complex non-core subunit NAF1 n=1 Tax=Quillaja saponaria TaxID=32244 RepID=A0AAD7QHI8_QUISA|nr:H/ACA ribonucleoprotein complex non-core subunit NAF1 [Quillaja saponaria]
MTLLSVIRFWILTPLKIGLKIYKQRVWLMEWKNDIGVVENSSQMVKSDSETDVRVLDQLIPNGSEPNVCGSTCVVKEECENLGSSSSTIVEGVKKICLAGGCSSSVPGVGVKNELMSNKDESESSESESVSTFSSSSSTSSSSGSDSDDDEAGQGERKADIEEGEIRDSEGQVTGTDDDDDGEEIVSCCGVDNIGDEEDEDGDAMVKPIRSKNEPEVFPSVPPVDVTLQQHHQMLPVGVVLSIVGAQVIVEGVEKHKPLNEGSILWTTESRSPLGLVDEIFGPVKNPYYIVRYNSETEVPAGIRGGTLISFVPEFANHVLNAKDLYKKGYDASGENDEEVLDDAEFSDDEKEAEYRRTKKLTKRGINDQKPGKMKNDRKKVKNRNGPWRNDHSSLQKEGVAPPSQSQHSVTPAALSLDSGNCSPFSVIGQGLPGGTSMIPHSNDVWTNGLQFQQPHGAPFHQPQGVPLQQPQGAPFLPPHGTSFQNVFPTSGMPWLPQNIQSPYQIPVPGTPFNGHFDPRHGSLPANMLARQQHNIFAGAMHTRAFRSKLNDIWDRLTAPTILRPPLWRRTRNFIQWVAFREEL